MPSISISTVSYNTSSGILTVTGSNLATVANSFKLTDFTLTGDQANSYTLSNSSLISGTPSSSQFKIQLSASDQLAINGLLNKNGVQANDGLTTYNLDLASGWESSATGISTQKVTVSNVLAPAITAVSYNAVSDQLSFKGSHLTAYGNAPGINLTDFKLSVGASNYTLTGTDDVLSNFSATGFTLTLNTVDQSVISSLLSANGKASSSGKAYKLSALKTWDGDSGAAISSEAVTVSGVPALGKAVFNASSGVLTLTGSALTTTPNSYTLSDFTFKGDGGQTYTLSGAAILSGVPSANSINFQLSSTDSQGLETILDKNGHRANDGKTTYNLSVASQWDSGGGALTSVPVSAADVIVPAINSINYNTATGVFTLDGNNFLDHGDSHNFNLADFKISAGNSSYTFSNSTDSVGNLSTDSFNIILGRVDKTLVNAFVNVDGLTAANGSAYSFSAASHWDNNSATNLSGKTVTVSAAPVLTAVSYNAENGILQLTGSNLGAINVGDLGIKGDAGVSYTLGANSLATGQSTASSVSIQLSATDQLAVDGLLNSNGVTATDGDSYQLTALSGWTSGAAGNSQSITVSNQLPPTISSVSYDAADGVLSVTGSNLVNHGVSSGLALTDFNIGSGSSRYSFTSSQDTVSNLTATGFDITLNSTAQTLVKGFINADGNSAANGVAYNLTAKTNWDSDNGAAINTQAVTVSNVAFANTLQTVVSQGLYAPGGLSIDSNGDLLIADTYDNAIKELPTGGGLVSAVLTGGLSLPADIKVDSSGDIYIANAGGNNIQEIIAGASNVVSVLSTGLNQPCSIAIDSSGNLFIADSGNNAIKEIVAGSNTVATLVSSGLNFPGDIVVDSQGNLYILDSSNNAVKELAAGSHTVTTVLSAGLNNPGGLGIDQYGDLFIADSGGNNIQEIVAGSHTVITLLTTGLNGPQGVAVDSLGDLFIADTNTGAIKEISLSLLPMVTTVNYDAATGSLTLSGQNLLTDPNILTVSDLTIKGDKAGSYTLGSTSTVSATSANTSISIQLSASDQFAINGLLNNNGKLAADGVSSFLLSVSGGWDGTAPIFNSQPITVSNFSAPAIASVSFNATTGVFGFTGSNLLGHGGSSALVVKDLSFSAGSKSYTFNSLDTISNISANGFTLTVGGANRTTVKTIASSDGASAANGQAYSISTSAGWDGDSSNALSTQAVTVYNVTDPVSVSRATYNAASGLLSLTGANLSSSSTAYALADLAIKGYAGGLYSLDSSSVASATSSADKLNIQLSAADQLAVDGLLNKNGSQAADGQTTYSLSLDNGWFGNNIAISNIGVTVSNVSAPIISTVSYNAASGVFSFSGGNLVADGGSNGITLSHISIYNGAGGSYTFNAANDTISNLTTNSFNISLGPSDQSAINALFDSNGNGLNSGQAYIVNVTAAWDSALGAAISKQPFTVNHAALSLVNSSGLNSPTGQAVDSQGDVFIADSGDNAIKEILAGSGNVLTLLSTGLNAPAGIAVDSAGNLYIADSGNNAIKEIAAGGSTVSTLVANGLYLPQGLAVDSLGNLYIADAGNNAVKEINTSLLSTTSLTGVSYNAASGVLTLNGGNLGTLAADFQPADLTLTGLGGNSYTLGDGSQVSGLLTNGSVSIQLSTADQLGVDGLLNRDGSLATDGSNYTLLAGQGWDALANPMLVQNVTASNVLLPVITAVTYDPANGVFSVSGANLINTGLVDGISLHDFNLIIGSASYTFNAAKDSVSTLTDSGFTLTLSSADQTIVNNNIKSILGAPSTESGYDLSTTASWDSNIGAATSPLAVSIATPDLSTLTTASVVSAISVPAATFISSETDPNQLAVSSYAFRDDGNLGYFTLNGVKQNNGGWITVTAANLSKLDYVGVSAGSENIDIAASNGLLWSNIATTSVTTLSQAPILSLLSNATIIAEVGKELVGNTLSYNGMLAILQAVAGNGAVTASEFNDLQTLAAHFVTSGGTALASDQIQVSSYVYDISNKLINGDAANAYWTGGGLKSVTLGNLAAGSTAIRLNELIGKWFLGTDLPIPTLDDAATGGTQTGTYTDLNTLPLYGASGMPKITDINQNQLGDCYLLASLGEVAKCDPAQIESMITNNGNGTYGIRFYVEGVATYITVNDQLPESGGVLLANQASDLWAELIEKAYVQLNADPGDTGHNAGNQWTMIDGGWADPLTQITDQTIAEYLSYLPNAANTGVYANTAWANFKSTIISAINADEEVLYASNGDSSSNGKTTFISSHMFMVTGYDTKTGDFILQNPWGTTSGQTWDTTFEASMSSLQTIGQGSIFIGLTGSTTANLTDLYMPLIGTNLDSTTSAASAPVSIINLVEGGGQIDLITSMFTAFAGQNTLTSDNFSNASLSTGARDFLYYNAANGGVYYDAQPAVASTGVEIAVIGVNSHPDALSLADFKLSG